MRSQVRLDFWAAPHTFYHDPFLLTNSWASPNHTLTMFSKNGAHSTKPRAAQQDLSDPGSLSLSFSPVPHFSSSPTGHGWTDTWSPGKVSYCRGSCSALCPTSPLTPLGVFPIELCTGQCGIKRHCFISGSRCDSEVECWCWGILQPKETSSSPAACSWSTGESPKDHKDSN